MKKIFMMLPLFAAVLMTGCTNDDLASEEHLAIDGVNIIEATIVDEGSRISLGEGGKVIWQKGDVIRLVQDVNGTPVVADYVAQIGGSNYSTFELGAGQVPVDPAQSTAYYPASLYDKAQGKAIIPATQICKVVDGKPAFDAPMSAAGSSGTLQFKNICAVLQLKLNGLYVKNVSSSKVTSIEVSANQPVSGEISITDDGAVVTDGTNKVTLNYGEGVDLSYDQRKSFYIALPIATYSGLTITVKDGDTPINGLSKTATNNSISMVRNHVYPLSFAEAMRCHAVQLWERGPWFATCNIGASQPTDIGDYFAWGETTTRYTSLTLNNDRGSIKEIIWKENSSTKYQYVWDNYFDSKGNSSPRASDFTKYSTATGKKTVLDPEDDAAHMLWGGDWRMISEADFNNINDANKCKVQYVTNYNGVLYAKGFIVYKKKAEGTYTLDDPHIFIPQCGFLSGTGLYTNNYTFVWTSFINKSEAKQALTVGNKEWATALQSSLPESRYYGIPVRAVSDTYPESQRPIE